MRNHGAVTVGRSIGEAFVLMWYLEKACRTQLTVMQSGGAICRPTTAVLAHTAKQFDNIPNPAGYSEWNALVKWFVAISFGIKVSGESTPLHTTPPHSGIGLADQPVRATDNDLNVPALPVPAVRGKKYLAGGTSTAGADEEPCSPRSLLATRPTSFLSHISSTLMVLALPAVLLIIFAYWAETSDW
jgi:hypothetical protein